MPQSKEQKTITNIYAMLTVSLLLSFFPMVSAALLSISMFLAVWIGAYVMRGKHDHDSLIANHMTYIIRTIWIAGLFSLVTMSIATAYILSVYETAMVESCGANLPLGADMAALQAAVQPCMDEFMSVNMPYFINGLIIAATPLVIYMGYRLAKGVSRAVKGHRIGDIKNWF